MWPITFVTEEDVLKSTYSPEQISILEFINTTTTTENLPYQHLQFNFKQTLFAESLVFSISDSTGKVIWKESREDILANDAAFFLWPYRNIESILPNMADPNYEAKLDAMKKSNLSLMKANEVVDINLVATKSGIEHTVPTQKVVVTSAILQNASYYPVLFDEFSKMLPGTIGPDDPPYELLKINYDRIEELKSSKIIIGSKMEAPQFQRRTLQHGLSEMLLSSLIRTQE
ncbi:MAG: hypothetical protein ATN31_11485 [Candidatus Epulonipiscioides saccharophilum]|nr:MAG: hypothetical protein ATN31_11485 [Epulopiscium sp. AS2M-Bin001]